MPRKHAGKPLDGPDLKVGWIGLAKSTAARFVCIVPTFLPRKSFFVEKNANELKHGKQGGGSRICEEHCVFLPEVFNQKVLVRVLIQLRHLFKSPDHILNGVRSDEVQLLDALRFCFRIKTIWIVQSLALKELSVCQRVLGLHVCNCIETIHSLQVGEEGHDLP
jgi:hypothetical protein